MSQSHPEARPLRPRRAFTLIEAVISIVILSIAVPPMIWALGEAHIQRVNPKMTSQGRWLAVEKLEDIIADRHSTTRGYSYVTAGNYPPESPVAGFPAFDREVTVNETTANLSTAGVGYKTVTVKVSWIDATKASRDMNVSTVLTDYSP